MPRCSMRVNCSSAATSHSTSTARAGMPPSPSSANGRGASRVQITTPSGAGSPDATPRVNGSACTGLWRRSVVNPGEGSAASATAPFSTARRLGRKPPGDTDTAKCQRAVFRDGDGQPYGVRLRRCCCANRLCTLPFRVTNDSYRDGGPFVRDDRRCHLPALSVASISRRLRRRFRGLGLGNRRTALAAASASPVQVTPIAKTRLSATASSSSTTHPSDVCVKRRNFGDAKPSRSAECCRTGFLRPKPTYAADNPFQP